MAAFNPDVKDVKPVNPIGWSKSADVPSQFASTLSEGIKGIGNIIGLGATAADELVKQSAQNKAEAVFRPEVDNEISRLAGLDFQLKLNQASTATTDAASTTGVAPTSEGVITKGAVDEVMPPPLRELPKTLSLLDGARANGHLSETAYLGRLTSLAKDLRSQYPVGYRDYIDSQISKITGVDPANAYMKSLVGDINANLTNQQAEKNKILSKLLEIQGLDPANAPAMYEGFSRGTVSRPQALNFIARNEAVDVNFKRNTQRFQMGEMNDKLEQSAAKQALQDFSSQKVASLIKGDLETKGLTVEAVQRIAEDPNKKLPPERYVELAADVKSKMLMAAGVLQKELSHTDKDRPNSYSKILGADGTKIIEDALLPYQRLIDSLEKKDIGLASMDLRMVEAANSSMASKLYKDPSMRFFFGTMDAIRKHGGGDSAVTQFFARGLEGKFGVDWAKYIEISKAELATPAPPPGSPDPKKNVNDITQFIKNTQTKEGELGIKTPESYAEAFSLVNAKDDRPSILNPSTAPGLKQAIAQNFFSDQTRGWLRLIKSDSIDANGRKLDGRETWFKNFTRPDVVEEISRMDGKTTKEYYDWVQTSYENIFGQTMKDLANTPSAAGFVIGWDDKANKIVYQDKGERTAKGKINADQSFAQSGLKLKIDRANSGIEGLANVYTKQGKSPEEVQAKVLESLNFQIDQYRMVNNLPTAFKASMEEKYRIRLEELAAEKAKKERADMNKAGEKVRREGIQF